MKFKMEISKNCITYGRLCCTVPDETENEIIFKDFDAFCRKKAKKEFGDFNAITERLDKELIYIKETDSVIFFEILREIATLSAGEGYPVSLMGEESGSLVLYLLGVSGIHPGEYEFRQTPTDLFIETARKRGELSLSLGIAEPIRKLIVPRLINEFDYIKSDENDWFEIDIVSWEMLDKIGKLSMLTRVHYSIVPVDDYLLAAVQSWDICETDLEWENISEDYCESITPLSVAKHYAFARCNCNTDKSYAAFSDMQKYIFRDDLYEAFTQAGLPSQKAYLLARNWLKGEDKEKEIEKLREYNIPLNAVYVFNELYNQWSVATCLSRVNALVLLRYYEFNYPKEFEELDYEVTGIIPTGFKQLDEILKGGFRKGDLILIRSKKETGAGSLARQIVGAVSRRNIKVAYFSYEERQNQIKKLMLRKEFFSDNIIVNGTSTINIELMRYALERINADIAVMDYYDVMTPYPYSEIKGNIAYNLRKLSEEFNIPIIVTKRESIYESETETEQDTSVIIRANIEKDSNAAQIVVEKNKYGDLGTVNATFDSEQRLFKEIP